MSYATIDELRSQLGGTPKAELSPEYRAKMLHPLPEATTVDREAFILKHCTGKRVLEFGASGPLHDAIVKVATRCIGVDREDSPPWHVLVEEAPANYVVGIDLDAIGDASEDMPIFEWTSDDGLLNDGGEPYRPDLIICGEVIEHLSNPGWFLTRLKRQYPGVPVIITVPNAFSSIAQRWIAKGTECVNRDHVAWYSPKTISVLLERAGYTVGQLFYYNGNGPTAEGLVVCTE